MPRQLIRLRDVRAPDQPNADNLSQAQVRQMASTAEDMEAYNSAVISQLRLAEGSQGWTQPPFPPASSGGAANVNGYPSEAGGAILGEALSGEQDGHNATFSLSHYAVPQTVKLFYNGLRLDVTADYLVAESVTGQGYDTIVLVGAVAPNVRDRLFADYILAS